MSNSSVATIIAGVAIAAGLVVGGFFISKTTVNSARLDTADVKGLAERTVSADLATWEIGYKVTAKDLKAGYADIAVQAATVRDFLTRNGFKPEQIVPGPTMATENQYRDANGALVETSYDITGSLVVSSPDVKAVDTAYQRVGELIANGVLVTSGQPRFLFTGINAIKPDMLREATQNARVAADEFAKNAGVTVGKIRSAAQGGFEVHDLHSGDYGTDDQSIEKTVRVVTNVTFYMD